MTTAAPAPETTPVVAIEPLKVADRCDRDGVAQAFVRARFMNGVLDLCAHHFVQNEEKIREQALQILDDREKINPKPSVSANAL